MDLAHLTLKEARDGLASKAFSAVELLEAVEKRIASSDGQLAGYLSRDFEAARKQAEQADRTSPLAGVPIAIKDNLNVEGAPCGCASRILSGYRAPYDATAIANLRAAGGIPYGRLNMDEFAMGSSTENSAFGPTRNPWDPERIPGGSSGASAASVTAHTALAALGSDTGGSIRQPAALCGCVGLKPTYGRVSRYGLVAFASSLDQIGPVTRTVEDAALLLGAISGHDVMDSTSLELGSEDFSRLLGQDLEGIRLGMPKEYFGEGVSAPVRSAVTEALRQLESLGAEIIDISLPRTEMAVATYYIIATAEASSNLARFDGVRYGYRSPDAGGILEQYRKTREEGFGHEVKRRILLGTYVLSSGYYDAYYLKAQKVRTLIRQDFQEAFSQVDAIVCPTTPSPAFKLGEKTKDPLEMYLADTFTIAVNLAGTCAMSLPCGFDERGPNRLPIGLQLIGKPLEEAELLRIAHAYEQATPWHRERPPIASR